MWSSIATTTLVACATGAVTTGIMFASAARALNNDPPLERLVGDPSGWLWAISPYAVLGAVAAAFRGRRGASTVVLFAAVPAILFALADTHEYLRPLPPGTHEFARGLGYGTPLVPNFTAIALVIAIKSYDGLQRLINPSPCKD